MSFNSIDEIKPQKGKQELVFSLLGKIDFMLLGGSRYGGKTAVSVMMSLAYQNDPNYRGIYFRKQSDQLIGGGSLDEYCKSMYTWYDSKRVGKPNICYKFPSGATVELRHMYNADDYEKHRGKSYSAVFFDEIDQFDQHEVEFLMTCLRSNADMNSFCVGTCNPSQSWVKPLVEWYLDETGIPSADKIGAIRYFIVKEGEFIFGDDEQFFLKNYPDSVYITNDKGETVYVPPKTFTFVFFNIFDNEIGQKRNPRYLSELKNKPQWQVQAELYGDWNAVPQKSQYWKREWLRGEKGERVKSLLQVPSEKSCITMRGVDKAHSEPSESYKYPDYTAWSPQFRKTREGLYYMVGNYHPDIKDPPRPIDKNPCVGRVRMLAGERDALIVKQAVYDGADCQVVLSRDKGSGAQDFRYTVSAVMSAVDEFGRPARIRVQQDLTQSNQADKKLKDFQPFCNACQQGLVYIVEDTFNKDTLEAIYKELEGFDGVKSSALKHDDFVDAISMTFNAISASGTPYRTLGSHQIETRSLAHDILTQQV